MPGDRPAVLHHVRAIMDDRNGLRLGKGDLLLLGEPPGLVPPVEAVVVQWGVGPPADRAGAAIFLEDEVVERDHRALTFRPASG